MIIRDYHGWFPPNAENDVHITVGMVRKREPMIAESAEFIVGNGGPVRDGVGRALTELGLDWREKLGNPGVYVTVIE